VIYSEKSQKKRKKTPKNPFQVFFSCLVFLLGRLGFLVPTLDLRTGPIFFLQLGRIRRSQHKILYSPLLFNLFFADNKSHIHSYLSFTGIAPSKGIAMKNLIVKKNLNNQIRMYLVETNVLAQTVQELTTKYIELLPTQYGIIFLPFY